MLKILNLNIWGYNKFDKRKKLIVDLIKKENPDVVAFQEIRDDSRFNKKGNNQLLQLNELLKYPYSCFAEAMDVNQVNKNLNDPLYDASNPRVREGVALLSKFPLISHKRKKLKQHPNDKYTRAILCAKLKYKNKKIDVFVVHFSADDLFSKLHLEETLKYAKNKKINPIIIGDFNIRYPEILNKVIGKDYTSSRQIKNYISYPPAKYTLDYILIPKMYKFRKFYLINNKVSDHKAIVGEIEV